MFCFIASSTSPPSLAIPLYSLVAIYPLSYLPEQCFEQTIVSPMQKSSPLTLRQLGPPETQLFVVSGLSGSVRTRPSRNLIRTRSRDATVACLLDSFAGGYSSLTLTTCMPIHWLAWLNTSGWLDWREDSHFVFGHVGLASRAMGVGIDARPVHNHHSISSYSLSNTKDLFYLKYCPRSLLQLRSLGRLSVGSQR